MPFWVRVAPYMDAEEDGDSPTQPLVMETLALSFHHDSGPHIKLKELSSNVLSTNSQTTKPYLQVAGHSQPVGGGAGPSSHICLSSSSYPQRPSLVQSQCSSLTLTQNGLHHEPCGCLCSLGKPPHSLAKLGLSAIAISQPKQLQLTLSRCCDFSTD